MTDMAKRKASKLTRKVRSIVHSPKESESLRRQLTIYQEHIVNLENDLKQKAGKTYKPDESEGRIRFVANQLDATGAPLVFMDFIKDFMAANPDLEHRPILHAFLPAEQKYIDELEDLGVKVVTHDRRDIAIEWVEGDVVILNTSAYETTFRTSIYESLERGAIKKLIWYVHEDWPEVFFGEDERKRVKKLLEANRMTMFIPAIKALKDYQEFFSTQQNLIRLPYRLNVDKQYYLKRQATDFDKLTFALVGRTGEGLKGHLPILYALIDFKNTHYKNDPARYRDFALHFIALESDYLSLQIKRHAGALGDSFKQFPPLSHAQALETIKNANVTICYSLRECLPVFVYEGMIMGHPILRNDASGMEEQLQEGVNGFFLDSYDFQQLVDTFEAVLNKKKTSNHVLEKMSQHSYETAFQATKNSYQPIIDVIKEALSTGDQHVHA